MMAAPGAARYLLAGMRRSGAAQKAVAAPASPVEGLEVLPFSAEVVPTCPEVAPAPGCAEADPSGRGIEGKATRYQVS